MLNVDVVKILSIKFLKNHLTKHLKGTYIKTVQPFSVSMHRQLNEPSIL